MGSREIVVKTLGPQFGLVQGLSGATVLGDGSVVVILDLMAMIRADASHLHRDLMLGQEETHADRDRPLLVMVVDDSVTVRKVTSRFLERQGMEVILAKDGIDAINLLQDSDRIPDVMLLDIEMPRMDGFEVASRIRHTSRLRDLPIIMITSRTGDKHRDRASALGVNKYLGKPYQETLLLETIHELTGTVTSE
jgi:chemosensory pili system protein ChpA (sensor histidine kinase/response regulator)